MAIRRGGRLQAGKIVRDILNERGKPIVIGFAIRGNVESQRSRRAAVRQQLPELVADQILKLRRKLFALDVIDCDDEDRSSPRATLQRAEKLGSLAPAPLRVQVRERNDHDDSGRLRSRVNEGRGDGTVASEPLRVPPEVE